MAHNNYTVIMVEVHSWKSALILLLLTTCSQTKPLESTTNISENFSENVENSLNYLEETLLEITKNGVKSANSKKGVDGTTASSQEEFETLETIKENLNDDTSENLAEVQQETTIYPENLTRKNISNSQIQYKLQNLHKVKENPVKKSEHNGTHSEPSALEKGESDKRHEESEDRFENELDENQSGTQNSKETTTISPEELFKKHKEQKFRNKFETNKDFHLQSESEDTQQRHLIGKVPISKSDENLNSKQSPFDNSGATTTICPEELAKRQEQTKYDEISVKTLLNVHKDSALFKLVEDKLNADGSGNILKQEPSVPIKEEFIKARIKRQTSNYFPYSSSQLNYNLQGLPMLSTDISSQTNPSNKANGIQSMAAIYPNNQLQSSYNSRVSNQQNNSERRPITYQQKQRQQYQYNPYPKYVKPVKDYQNPSLYARYPSNHNVKSYYKLNQNVANRRQFQTSARPSKSPTVKPGRVAIKRKFRPSPVFA